MESESVPKICLELLPPDEKRTLPPSNFVPSPLGSGPLELALDKNLFWRNGQKLRVSFLSGSQFVPGKVREYAKTWEKYANIRFEFIQSPDAEIRIDFQQGGGSWSYLGSTNLQIPKGRPTMNFGWFNDQIQDGEFLARIPWDRPAVYKYFKGPPNNWSEATIDHNLFNKYPESAAVYSRFDPLSIMCYEVSDDFTIGTFSVPRNMVLSAMDKSFIRQAYPPQSRSVGAFNTMEIRPWCKPQLQNSKQFVFDPAFNQPPSIAVGLTSLDISKDANVRVNAYADRITEKDFVVHADSWSDTLEVANTDSDLQVGEFNTQELHPWNQPRLQHAKRINFERSFLQPPKVLVWLKGVDMDKSRNWRVTAYASDINAESFVVNLDAWGDTIFYSGAVSWIAYPADKENAFGGLADTTMQKDTGPKAENGGRVVFPQGMFDKPPTVLVR